MQQSGLTPHVRTCWYLGLQSAGRRAAAAAGRYWVSGALSMGWGRLNEDQIVGRAGDMLVGNQKLVLGVLNCECLLFKWIYSVGSGSLESWKKSRFHV